MLPLTITLAVAVLALTAAVCHFLFQLAALRGERDAARTLAADTEARRATAYATGYSDGTEYGRQAEAREQAAARRSRARMDRSIDELIGLN